MRQVLSCPPSVLVCRPLNSCLIVGHCSEPGLSPFGLTVQKIISVSLTWLKSRVTETSQERYSWSFWSPGVINLVQTLSSSLSYGSESLSTPTFGISWIPIRNIWWPLCVNWNDVIQDLRPAVQKTRNHRQSLRVSVRKTRTLVESVKFQVKIAVQNCSSRTWLTYRSEETSHPLGCRDLLFGVSGWRRVTPSRTFSRTGPSWWSAHVEDFSEEQQKQLTSSGERFKHFGSDPSQEAIFETFYLFQLCSGTSTVNRTPS